jgi:hypothetical protein
VLLGGTVMASAAVGTWALQPSPRAEWKASTVRPSPVSSVKSDDVAAIDRSVFERALWRELPNPTSAETTKEPAKPTVLPLELDLIGVTSVDGKLVAALYDRRHDHLMLVKHGEKIEGAEVTELTADRVTLTRAGAQLVLSRKRAGP